MNWELDSSCEPQMSATTLRRGELRPNQNVPRPLSAELDNMAVVATAQYEDVGNAPRQQYPGYGTSYGASGW